MNRPLNFLSLFAGIGGIDLGLERAGMRCVAQVEIDPFCRRVLEKHWPDVPRFEDVRTVNRETLAGLDIDLIAGGFPCQDISLAGRGAGIGGERSGLWSEYCRLIREIRPPFVLVENVRALLVRGVDRVLGDLAAGGYDAEWDCLPAAAFRAPHIRDRVFLLAYPTGVGRGEVPERQPVACRPPVFASRFSFQGREGSAQVLGHAHGAGLAQRQGVSGHAREEQPAAVGAGWWASEPDVGRVAHGVPARVDRLRGLGNAVVPQVAEWIGRRIVEAAEAA